MEYTAKGKVKRVYLEPDQYIAEIIVTDSKMCELIGAQGLKNDVEVIIKW